MLFSDHRYGLTASNFQKVIIGVIVAVAINHGDTSYNTECDKGYIMLENVCEETCELSPCKELITQIMSTDVFEPNKSYD